MRLRVSLRGQALVHVLLCARGSAHASESRTSKENNQHGASLASQTPHPNSRQKKTKHNTRRSCDTMPHARARSALRGLQRPTLASPRLDAGTSAPSHMHPSHARTHRILDAGRHPNIAGTGILTFTSICTPFPHLYPPSAWCSHPPALSPPPPPPPLLGGTLLPCWRTEGRRRRRKARECEER